MKIHFVSDLHTDLHGNELAALPDVDADVVVVAGDAMAPGHLAIRCVRELFKDCGAHIVYVPGNHDYYSYADKHHPELRTTYEKQRYELMPIAAQEAGIILLDDNEVEIDGVTFIGSTLWTDMLCSPSYMQRADVLRAAGKMNDYRAIKVGEGRGKDRLRPSDTIAFHKESRAFIEQRLAANAGGDVVVVTHHAPSSRSLRGYEPGRFQDLDWCYASDLENLMHGDAAPALWLHGHIHQNRDYTIGDTRVVANPRGYTLYGRRENPDFNPALVIEIEPKLSLSLGVKP